MFVLQISTYAVKNASADSSNVMALYDPIGLQTKIAIRIYHELEGGIEKIALVITFWHHEACQMILFVCFVALRPSQQLLP